MPKFKMDMSGESEGGGHRHASDAGTASVEDKVMDDIIFTIMKGARLPALAVEILDENGDLEDLTDYQTATFTMKDADGNTIANAQSADIDKTNSIVTYAWGAGDTDTAGPMSGEFSLTDSSSRVLKLPIDKEHLRIIIHDSV